MHELAIYLTFCFIRMLLLLLHNDLFSCCIKFHIKSVMAAQFGLQTSNISLFGSGSQNLDSSNEKLVRSQ